jgi:hypothetical protein
MESIVHQRQLQNNKETTGVSDNQQNMHKTPHLPTDKSGALNYEIMLHDDDASYPYIVETPLKPDTGTALLFLWPARCDASMVWTKCNDLSMCLSMLVSLMHACFYDTSKGNYKWHLVTCNQLST